MRPVEAEILCKARRGNHELLSVAHRAVFPLRSGRGPAGTTAQVSGQDKLFTFINHDGVPWNNNNAEHAIEQFAYYREQTTGMLRDTGLGDYLVLLSKCQTCQYEGISFLQFHLSQERHVDTFCERQYRKRSSPTIEL